MEHFLGGKRSGRPFWGGKKRKEYPFCQVHDFGIWILRFCLFVCLFVCYLHGGTTVIEIHRAVLVYSFLYTRYLFVLWSLNIYTIDIIDLGHGASALYEFGG